MRTKQEIDAEIAALKALVPIGKFISETQSKIELAIEELEYGVDQTAEEWNELSDEERDIVIQTQRWKEGDNKGKPSEGWEGLAL